MKKLFLSFAAIVMIAGFTTTAMAQTSDDVTTNAGAKLLIPMTLNQGTSLQFGNIAKFSVDSGSVTLSTTGQRSFIGGASGLSGAAETTISNATYTVTGNYNHSYALTLPVTFTVLEAGAVATMTISALTVKFTGGVEISGVNATSTLSAAGTDSFIVGGTLNIATGQIGGVYAGTFNVSVDYN